MGSQTNSTIRNTQEGPLVGSVVKKNLLLAKSLVVLPLEKAISISDRMTTLQLTNNLFFKMSFLTTDAH